MESVKYLPGTRSHRPSRSPFTWTTQSTRSLSNPVEYDTDLPQAVLTAARGAGYLVPGQLTVVKNGCIKDDALAPYELMDKDAIVASLVELLAGYTP